MYVIVDLLGWRPVTASPMVSTWRCHFSSKQRNSFIWRRRPSLWRRVLDALKSIRREFYSKMNWMNWRTKLTTDSVSEVVSPFLALLSSVSNFWKAVVFRANSFCTAPNRCSSKRSFCFNASSVRSSTVTRSALNGLEWFSWIMLNLASKMGGCGAVGVHLCCSMKSLNSPTGSMSSTLLWSELKRRWKGSELKLLYCEISLITTLHCSSMSSCTICWNSKSPVMKIEVQIW